MRILQITDFHLDNIADTKEHLRSRNYKEYINELVSLIKKEIGSIDYIVATGDFINKYKFENFDHAKNILLHLAKKLELDKDVICVCNGNHDYDFNQESLGNSAVARSEYYKFRENFAHDKIVKSNDFAILYKLKDIWCLSLDSTWNTKGSNIPKKLLDIEIDEIVNDFVIDNVPDEERLVILSHYPMIHFDRAIMDIEEPNWVLNHEWKDAYYIVERLYKIRKNQHTIYFFGDGHIPDFTSYNEFSHFIMSAMFGSGTTSLPNQIAREAKVFEISDDNIPRIFTCQYRMRGYKDSALIGDWKFSESKIRLNEKNSLKIADENKGADFINEIKTSKTPRIISTSIQNSIIDKITKDSLYSLDRYATSDSKVSLSWIYINKLLSDLNILTQISNRVNQWLIDEVLIGEVDINKFTFIGIDYWGAILASQVSIRTNINCYCIASKAGSNNYTYKESVNYLKHKKDKFVNTENVILFTDVIATGDTVFRKKKKIEELLEMNIKNWYIVSVIGDKEQNRGTNLDEFKEIVTFCSDLRTPLLSIHEIPNEEIVPTRLDFRLAK